MSSTTRAGIALGFAAAVVVAGVAFAGGGPDDDTNGSFGRRPFRHHVFGLHEGIVHGEMIVQTDDGFATRIFDAGEVTAVDADAGTLTIERADGEAVTVTVDGQTRISRDRDEATLADIRTGDRAHITQLDAGDGPVVRFVGVLSPQAYERLSDALEERGNDRMDGRARFRDHLRRFRERFREHLRDDA